MQTPRISAIAAIGQNRELGKDNDLIWRIPADLKRLKELTTGKPIIMGRKTYESIGRPLPNRTNIVISRDSAYVANGCVVVSSIEDALAIAVKTEAAEIFIFGGAGIYSLAWPLITNLYLTIIHDSKPDADVFFPDYKTDFVVSKTYEPEIFESLGYQWLDLERVG